ncbi:SCY1-like protein 2 isoform X3 [Glossina fuscipes]|uniref:SCY1-like protein 2 isoform X3 n=1 Tax=Glossina fuscipes TaxID=7396 RepID=A0A9C5ZQI3_9MUSC|nr:SCY1-like protein 2 isoform X3 [Glossina fuscipes]
MQTRIFLNSQAQPGFNDFSGNVGVSSGSINPTNIIIGGNNLTGASSSAAINIGSGSGGGGVGGGGGGGIAVGPKRQGSFSNVFAKLIDGMPAGTMFSKFKSANIPSAAPNVADTNPIKQYFDIGKQIACAGPELVWKIHEAFRKSDGKECSIFIFEKRIAEKLHKPRRKETVTELLKTSVKTLERFRHPKILQILHTVEESAETLAFAAEPIYASLANILAFHESKTYENVVPPPTTSGNSPLNQNSVPMPHKPSHAKNYQFLDIELKYGFLQLVEALSYLHYSGHVIHRNVCPSSILVTKRGTWKLSGLEFIERMNETDLNDSIPCQPWSNRLSKMAQPNLNFIAPETQLNSKCSLLSDMFSLGLVICAVFNRGRPLIQAANTTSNYIKQLEMLEENVQKMLPRVPVPLQEATSRLVNKEPTARPTAQLLQLIKYFIDPAVNALKFLDVVNMKDTSQKSHFYKVTLMETMPLIPRKLWWQNVWPMLQAEINNGEVLAAVLQPVITLLQEATHTEYETIMAPTMKVILSSPKSIQATVTLLENLHLIIEKTQREDVNADIMPMLFASFDSSTIQVQNAAVVAITNVYDKIDELSIRRMVLPKVKSVFERNLTDPKIVQNVLVCIERTMDKFEKPQVTDELLVILGDVHIPEPDIIMRTVRIYNKLFTDKVYGVTVEAVAINILPLLLPHTVNPNLNYEQYCQLIEIIHNLLEHIDRHQRNRLKLDNLSIPSPERHRSLRHQFSTDNMNAIPPFNIPNLRIDQRKTSSAEDMARKNSGGSGMLGGWWFGGPASPDSNFLRVANAFPNRRLSDNTLMTPKIRIAPSCASSPGGTPGSGLPTRRHSSIGPQERRGSTINLSPPTLARSMFGGSMPNTSSSVPFLLSSSMQSIRSRRPSTVLSTGPLGSGTGLWQQLGSGMVRQITSVSGTATPVPLLNINGQRQSVRKCPSLNITFTR